MKKGTGARPAEGAQLAGRSWRQSLCRGPEQRSTLFLFKGSEGAGAADSRQGSRQSGGALCKGLEAHARDRSPRGAHCAAGAPPGQQAVDSGASAGACCWAEANQRRARKSRAAARATGATHVSSRCTDRKAAAGGAEGEWAGRRGSRIRAAAQQARPRGCSPGASRAAGGWVRRQGCRPRQVGQAGRWEAAGSSRVMMAWPGLPSGCRCIRLKATTYTESELSSCRCRRSCGRQGAPEAGEGGAGRGWAGASGGRRRRLAAAAAPRG